jgi:hypothetical protein
MFTATLSTIAAVAALSTQTVNPSTPATVAAATPSAEVTAVSTVAAPQQRARVRIPGTFNVGPDDDILDGVRALYVVRSGDGA